MQEMSESRNHLHEYHKQRTHGNLSQNKGANIHNYVLPDDDPNQAVVMGSIQRRVRPKSNNNISQKIRVTSTRQNQLTT